MLLAASTQRTIGLVILAIVFIGGLVYLYFNIRSARDEVGSEIELAPNRSEPLTDETLEGKRLDLNLGAALVMLTIVGVALPVYWLGEPGRHEGRIEETARIFTDRGEELYTENCAQCHSAGGTGGVAPLALTDDAGNFIAQVSWKAPALNTVLSRFSEDEITHTLNFGRNGVMPAWGAPGGGAMTAQQLEEIIFYLRSIQIDEATIRAEVGGGVVVAVAEDLGVDPEDPAVDAFFDDVDAAVEAAREMALADPENEDLAEQVAGASTEGEIDAAEDALRRAALELLSQPGVVPGGDAYLKWGEYLFANRASAGTYSCARCHTAGWSYDAASDFTKEVNGIDGPLPGFEDGYVQGRGFFGPNLTNGSTLNQFATASSHSDFICEGQNIGQTYGAAGSGGNGQMPGMCERTDADLEITWPATLTIEEIDAIVAYERSL